MCHAICIFQGEFGRVALLDMDRSLVPHAHLQCHVLIKITGDDAHFGVRGKLQPFTDRHAVLVNAWEPHFYGHIPEAPHTIILALYIEPSWLATIQSSLQVSGYPGFFRSPSVRINARIRALADELATYMLSPEAMTQDRVESMTFELMLAVIEPFSEWHRFGSLISGRKQQAHDPRIKRAIHYMRENLDNPIDVDQLASRVGLSRAHFFTQFRRCTHVTPNVFLNTLRMEFAVKRLGRNRSTVLSELSLDLGFSAQSHFTRFFRHHLGITPSEYRQIVDVFGVDATDEIWSRQSPNPPMQSNNQTLG